MQQIYKRISMPKCDFSKLAITVNLQCYPVNLLYNFRTSFPKNSSGVLQFFEKEGLKRMKSLVLFFDEIYFIQFSNCYNHCVIS